LFAFLTVAAGVMILRKREPDRHRPFRAPGVWIVAPLAMAGCAFLMFSLPLRTQLTFFIWAGIGLLVYAMYGYGKSPLGQNGGNASAKPAPVQD
jgi:APA family basic amino acid/polyamine antiporter